MQKLRSKKSIVFIAVFLISLINFLIMPHYYSAIPLILFAALMLCGVLSLLVIRGEVDSNIRLAYKQGEDNSLRADIEIYNKGVLPKISLKITVAILNMLTGEKKTEVVYMSIGPRSKKITSIDMNAKLSGCYRISIEGLESADLLNVFKRNLAIHSRKEIEVFPKLEAIEIGSNVYSSFNIESFQYSQFKIGNDPGEIRGVREYQIGDNPKHIHWKLSGKMEDIVVRELGYPVENDILLMLDYAQLDDEKAADKKMSICFSISQRLLEKTIVHNIGWYDREEKTFCIRPVKNTSDRDNVMKRLLRNQMLNEEVSTIRRFVSETEVNQRVFSHYLYISDDDRDLEQLLEYGELNVFGTKEKRLDNTEGIQHRNRNLAQRGYVRLST